MKTHMKRPDDMTTTLCGKPASSRTLRWAPEQYVVEVEVTCERCLREWAKAREETEAAEEEEEDDGLFENPADDEHAWVEVADCGDAGPRENPVAFRLYHVTDPSSAEAIEEEGFAGGWGDAGFGVYFFTNRRDADAYAAKGGWDGSLRDPVVLSAEVPAHLVKTVKPHPDWPNPQNYENVRWVPLDEDDEDARLEVVVARENPAADGSSSSHPRTAAFRRWFKDSKVVDAAAVATAPEHQRRGLARKLVQRVLRYRVESVDEPLSFEAYVVNEAAMGPLLASLGFVEKTDNPGWWVLAQPRENPIPARDPTFSLDPYEWVAGTVLEDYCEDEDDAGFFHVTTRGAKVFEEGRLRSRKDVGAVGLGGGRTDPGHHVSVVVSYSRARWLYDAIKGLARACHHGTAVDVVKLVLDWTGFPGDNWNNVFDDEPEDGATWPVDLLEFVYEIGMTNVGGESDYGRHDLTTRSGWNKLLAEEGGAVNKKWKTPGQRYKLAQGMEDRLESTFYIPEWWDDGICVPLVGFTAQPADFLKIDPDDVTIVQVALRETGGRVEDIPRECELRLPPADIQIVAVGVEDPKKRLLIPPRFDDDE